MKLPAIEKQYWILGENGAHKIRRAVYRYYVYIVQYWQMDTNIQYTHHLLTFYFTEMNILYYLYEQP